MRAFKRRLPFAIGVHRTEDTGRGHQCDTCFGNSEGELDGALLVKHLPCSRGPAH